MTSALSQMGRNMQPEHNATVRWTSHPVLARLLRVAIVVVPFLTAMAVAFVLSAQLPIAESLPVRIARWLGIVMVSTLAMMVVDRLARRLLPLSALLKLTLVFPDQAPSRFNVAMRTGTTAQLKKRIQNVREVPLDETPQQAAERLLELVGLLSHHDRLTRGHSERVRAYTHLIGEELGLTGSELDKLRWAGLLHDIGKIAIDTDILNKPGKLTDTEYEAIQAHPDHGRALVGSLAPWLGESIRAVWEHHERFDGNGYPQGLSGLDISFAARVVTVADSYDVMTSARSYKQPMPAAAARAELATCSGSQFDPVVVRAFLNLSLGRLRFMNGPLAWLAQLALFEPAGVVHAGGSVGGGSTGSTAMVSGSTSTAAGAGTAAAAGGAGVASTVAATAVAVAASTAGIVAATPDLVIDDAPTAAVAYLEVDAAETVETVLRVETNGGRLELDAPRATAGPSLVQESGRSSSPTAAQDSEPTSDPSDEQAMAVLEKPSTSAPRETAGTASTSPPSTNRAVVVPTTAASGTPSVATTTTTVAPATTTTSTTTTTTAPTVPTTAAPTTVAVPPPTVPPPPTTVPDLPLLGPGTVWYLGGATADSAAADDHAISSTPPPVASLPNLDTNRDAAPGVLVQKDSAGINTTDPTKVVVFRGQVAQPRHIDGDVHIDMYVAPKDFNRSDINLEVGLYACSVADGCQLVERDSHQVRNSRDFRKARFHLHNVDVLLAPGQWVEVRVAVLSNSQDDAWLAFGVDDYDSQIQLPATDAGNAPGGNGD